MGGGSPPDPQPAARPSKNHRIRTGMSESLQQGLTMHAHCGVFSRTLVECLRVHSLPQDPFELAPDDPRMGPCLSALRAFQMCGKDFLHSTRVSQERCDAEVRAAREACDGNRPDCAELESLAIRRAAGPLGALLCVRLRS